MAVSVRLMSDDNHSEPNWAVVVVGVLAGVDGDSGEVSIGGLLV